MLLMFKFYSNDFIQTVTIVKTDIKQTTYNAYHNDNEVCLLNEIAKICQQESLQNCKFDRLYSNVVNM